MNNVLVFKIKVMYLTICIIIAALILVLGAWRSTEFDNARSFAASLSNNISRDHGMKVSAVKESCEDYGFSFRTQDSIPASGSSELAWKIGYKFPNIHETEIVIVGVIEGSMVRYAFSLQRELVPGEEGWNDPGLDK